MDDRAPQAVRCPHCGGEFPLSQVLTREIEERLRPAFEARLREAIERERAQAAAGAERRARETVEIELRDLKTQVQEKEKRVQALVAEELKLRQRQRELEERERKLQHDVQRAMDEERKKLREEQDEEYRLKVADKDKLIADMSQQLAELKRKAEQGSQQLQGEVQEIELEAVLRGCCPQDEVVPVELGRRGADVLQRVAGNSGGGGGECGAILWESKRTKHWSPGWIQKLKDDQRAAKADVAVLISQTLPDGVRHVGIVEGVWVTDFRFVELLATVLRRQLTEVAHARSALAGKQEKMDLIYQYLTGPDFRRRLEAVVESFIGMSADLEKERRALESLWDKRQSQIRKAFTSLSGLYGELQGIAALPPVKELELPPPPSLGARDS